MNEEITASAGKTFRRKHDEFVMGATIVLGFDYSTGEKRIDLAEYYEEVEQSDNNEIINEQQNINTL